MSEELTRQRTPEIIAAEIRGYSGMMLTAVLEIGKRFCEVKELLPHGDFMPWIEENTGYKQSSVNQYMQLYRAYGDKALGAGYAGLTLTKAAALLSLPEVERDDFIQEHPVQDMTTKELKQAIRERDEALAEVERARRDEKAAKDTVRYVSEHAEKDRQALQARIKDLENRPVEVAVQEPDADTVEKLAAELADKTIAADKAAWEQKLKAAEDKLAKAEDQAKKAKDKLKTTDENAAKKSEAELEAAKREADAARIEVEKLRAELAAAKDAAANAKIAGDGDLALVKSYAEELIGYANKLHGILRKAQANGNGELANKVSTIFKSVAEQIGGLA